MKYAKLALLVLAGAFAKAHSGATGWYKVSTLDFYRLEEMNTSTKIVLATGWGKPAVNIAQPDGVSPCLCEQVELTPPAGKETRWLTMLLSGVASSKYFYFYGDCDPQSKIMIVNASTIGRIQLE